MKKFHKETWAVIGYILGIVGTFVTIFTLSGSLQIKTKWIVIGGIVVLISVVFAIKATLKLKKVLQNGTQYGIIAYGKNKGSDVYYTNYSKSLRFGTLVSIYYSEPYNRKIGIGIVNNYSVDEYTEIYLKYVEPEFENIFNQSKTNNRKVLRNMYILPNTYIEDLQELVKIFF